MKVSRFNFRAGLSVVLLAVYVFGCSGYNPDVSKSTAVPEPEYFLSTDKVHNKFSSKIPPVLTVPSGAVVEVQTKEATDGQLSVDSDVSALQNLDSDRIHALTGPVFVEGAEPGDILAVTLLKIDVGDWAWSAIMPGFGLLPDEFSEPYLKTYKLEEGARKIRFTGDISIPVEPFAGVMGVAPPTGEMLVTIPPRANGGNMDNPFYTVGTTVYFPVFVKGGLFSIGDTHAAQGLGEVCGTAVEAPMRIVYQIQVIKGKRALPEPQYETDDYYAVTAFAPTLDDAARKATRYMIDYLTKEHNLSREDAYVLCSLAGDLHIAEVVDMPNVLVSMHISKQVLGMSR